MYYYTENSHRVRTIFSRFKTHVMLVGLNNKLNIKFLYRNVSGKYEINHALATRCIILNAKRSNNLSHEIAIQSLEKLKSKLPSVHY